MSKNTRTNNPSDESNRVLERNFFSNSQEMNKDKNEPNIKSILEGVSAENFKHYLNNLSDFHTRYSKSPILKDIGD